MRLIFTCGGTAGHINPALAVAGRMQKRIEKCNILFIGAENNMEMDLVPRENYDIQSVKITNISRGHDFNAAKHNAETVKNVIFSLISAKKIIRDFNPDAVIGTGGYVCYPVIMAAHELGIPTIIHESNAAPGLTTRLLARNVNRILVGFEDCRKYYPDPKKIEVTGTPVRGDFSSYSKRSAREYLHIPENMPVVLSVWGSLGAEYMNRVVCDMIPQICENTSFQMIHATGNKYYNDFISALNSKCPDFNEKIINIYPYIHDMARVMTAADLIICRAGASTLSELTFMGKPAILIPSPNVTNNHQEKNARLLERAGGALVKCENEINSNLLYDIINTVINDSEKLERMGINMRAVSSDNASDMICDSIINLISEFNS